MALNRELNDEKLPPKFKTSGATFNEKGEIIRNGIGDVDISLEDVPHFEPPKEGQEIKFEDFFGSQGVSDDALEEFFANNGGEKKR